jgi:hypothetical protein
MRLGMDVMSFEANLKSRFLITCNRLYQHVGCANLRGGIDTRATYHRVVQWRTLTELRCAAVLFTARQQHVGCIKQYKINRLEFDALASYIRVQHAATHLTHITLHRCCFPLHNEEIKNAQFALSEIKVK